MKNFDIKSFSRDDTYIKDHIESEIIYTDTFVFSDEYLDFPIYVVHSEGYPIIIATFAIYDVNRMSIPEEYLSEKPILESEVYLAYTKHMDETGVDIESVLDSLIESMKSDYPDFCADLPVERTICSHRDITALLKAYNKSHNYIVTVMGFGTEKYKPTLIESLFSMDRDTFKSNEAYYSDMRSNNDRLDSLGDLEFAYGSLHNGEYEAHIYIGDDIFASANISIIKDVAFLSSVYVSEQYRHIGLATELLIFVLGEYFSEYESPILLNLRDDNTNALGLYKKLGFKNDVTKSELYVEM